MWNSIAVPEFLASDYHALSSCIGQICGGSPNRPPRFCTTDDREYSPQQRRTHWLCESRNIEMVGIDVQWNSELQADQDLVVFYIQFVTVGAVPLQLFVSV